MLEAPELGLGTALALALAAVWDEQDRSRLGWLVALGALAGLQVMVELNIGLVTVGLAVLAVAGGARRGRRAASGCLSFLVAVLLAAAITRQNLSNLGSYLRGSLQVTLGYSSAMSTSSGRGAEDVFAAVLALLVALIFGLAARQLPKRAKWSVATMLAGWGWEALKEGFVRHDLHDLTFLGLMVVVLALARLPRHLLPLQGCAFLTAMAMALVANGGVVDSLHSPIEDARALGTEVYDLALGGSVASQSEDNRLELLETGDDLPASGLRALSPYTVAGDPFEVGLSYAYPQLRWGPEPVLQSYSAYTSYLDNLDARFLASKKAPERILDQALAIDGQDPWWAPSSTDVALVCHYEPLGSLAAWQVLARVPDRCGPARLVRVDHAPFGQRVKVPTLRGDLVVAAFSLTSPLWARLEGWALKPPATFATTWTPRQAVTYRFLPGTAADEHIIDIPTRLRYGSGFAPAPVKWLTMSGGGWSRGQGRFTVTFYALAVRP
jgi:hypothetical protein